MRRRFIYDKHGNCTEVTGECSPELHQIMPEIEGYKSMIDGSFIDSRRKHREHLKRHNMREVDPSEVATEKILNHKQAIPDAAPQQRKELIRAQIDAMSQDEFKRALQRDIDNVKWNSRTR